MRMDGVRRPRLRRETPPRRPHIDILIKLDLFNAFNSVFPRSCAEAGHSAPTRRYATDHPSLRPADATLHSGKVIWFCRDVQQDDPLGPLLFALAIAPIVQSLYPPLNVWYLDDGTLAGPADTVAADISTLLPALQHIDLMLSQQKSVLVELGDASLLGNSGSNPTHDDVTQQKLSDHTTASQTPSEPPTVTSTREQPYHLSIPRHAGRHPEM